MPNTESEFTLKDGVLRFKHEANSFPPTTVKGLKGKIIRFNRSHEQKQREPRALEEWEVEVARAVKAKRAGVPWNSAHRYAVTLQFRFRQRQHRSQEGDLDNYVKPVLDGLAAGLFLPEDTDPGDVWPFTVHRGVNDQNFRTLLIRRVDDLNDDNEPEEVRLFVSRCGNAPPE